MITFLLVVFCTFAIIGFRMQRDMLFPSPFHCAFAALLCGITLPIAFVYGAIKGLVEVAHKE